MDSKISFFYKDLTNDSFYKYLTKIRQILIDEDIDRRREIFESFKVFAFIPNKDKLESLSFYIYIILFFILY